MKKPVLAVAIPAYNEKANIENLLSLLVVQKTKNFSFAGIRVYTDAGTDNTPEIVERFARHNKLVKLIRGKSRKGKYKRVNQMFRECTEDILVVLDADISPVDDHFLEKLTSVFLHDKKAEIVAAHQVLLQPKTFVGKILHANFMLWDYVRWSIPNHGTANNYYGSATAYTGDFARRVHIPATLTDPHLFIYMMSDATQGFRYTVKAQVLQWPVTTIADYKKLLQRSIGKRDEVLEKMFGKTLEEIYFVPLRCKVTGMLRALYENPLYTVLAIGLNIYMQKVHPPSTQNSSAVWEIVTSTKKHIQYGK